MARKPKSRGKPRAKAKASKRRRGRKSPPRAAIEPTSRVVHGVTLADDYSWLRDPNWREVMRDPGKLDKKIRAYLEAENAYTDSAFRKTAKLQKLLVKEMRARIKEDDSSVPARDGDFSYYARYRKGGQHPLICRMPSTGGREQVLLDSDRLAKGHAYFHLGATDHSPDHKLLAWSVDDAGSEFHTIRVRDLSSGKELADVIADTTGGAVWAADASGFFYVRLDADHRPSKVFFHRIGTPSSADKLIYEEPDKGFFMSVGRLQAGVFGVIACGDSETSEVQLLELAKPLAKPVVVEPRQQGVRYSVEHHPSLNGVSTLVIQTNADESEDFKIVLAPVASPGRANWRDFIPHRPGTMILDIAVFRDWIARLERTDGLPRIAIRDVASGKEHEIAFEEEAYSLGMSSGYEFVTDQLRFSYSSMTTPSETWDYDMRSRERELKKRQEVPSGHDPERYVTRRIFAQTPDGETVPISILHLKKLPLNGMAPCLLYGYGSYGISIPASFSTNRLSLVDRGFVYAIAHIRGGTEKGWRWYREGKLTKKENTFTDFISCAEHLCEMKFTSPDRIVAQGGSAGGMLMGTVANMRPDLFKGVIAEVPFVDVLNTILDDTLPLTPPEWFEWGNPITDADAFHRIRGYSPYDNVKELDYPAMLVLAGLTDPRVTYWEPAKWMAKLRAKNRSENPLYLRTNMDAGHGGAAGRFDRLDEVGLTYAFALKVAGLA